MRTVQAGPGDAQTGGPGNPGDQPFGRGRGARPRRAFTGYRWAALGAGALPALAFPRAGLDWSAWVALVPGLLLARAAPSAREAAVRGWWFGAGYLIAMLHWLTPSIGPGLLLVALVFGALWTGWGVAARALIRAPCRSRWPAAMVVVPSAWLVIELVRSWAALGGPWALLGASQWRHPAVLQLASLGGIWLVSFAVVAANTAVALLCVAGGRRERAVAVLLAAATVAAGPVLFALRAEPPAARTLRLALVQPGLTPGPAARFEAQEKITAGLVTAGAPRRTYDLVVWGESSVGYDLDRRPDLVRRLAVLSAGLGADLLVNVDAQNAAGRISKAALLIGPGGIEERYVKTRLVPFGEYIPFRGQLGWLRRISRAAWHDRVPGTGITVMHTAGTTVGPLVCFESAFPDLARAEARRGAAVIVYQSATSTFQDSWGPAQHAALGAVRAAETGRPVAQAALTGISVAYDPRGRRLARLETGRRGVADVRVPVPPTRVRTPYVTHGDYVPLMALAVAAVAAMGALPGMTARISPARR